MAKQCQFHHIVAKYSCSQMLKTYCPDESFDPPFLPAASGMVFQSFMSSSIVFLFYSHFSSLTFQPLTLIFQFEPKIKLQNIQKHFKLPLSDYWSHYHCMGSWFLFTKLPCTGSTDPCTIHSMKGRCKQKALIIGCPPRALAPEAFKVRSKGLDWSMGSIQGPWYARLHPRAARSRAKRTFSSSSRNKS